MFSHQNPSLTTTTERFETGSGFPPPPPAARGVQLRGDPRGGGGGSGAGITLWANKAWGGGGGQAIDHKQWLPPQTFVSSERSGATVLLRHTRRVSSAAFAKREQVAMSTASWPRKWRHDHGDE